MKRKKTEDQYEHSYALEPVKPELIRLPKELKSIDFQRSGAAAWGKFSPYNPQRHLRIAPLDEDPVFNDYPALCFQVNGIDGRARCGTLHFPNGGPPVPTPRFMPVGTKGTLKSVLPDEIAAMKCPIILANTYHLEIQPGTEMIDSIFGGLHNFMGGTAKTTTSEVDKDSETNKGKNPRRLFNLLTDSGGFQMVSLASLSVVTETGVLFQSPYTGEHKMLRPEDSIRCQNDIGADIIMQLDDVISSVTTDDERFRLATLRTLRWYDRCLKAHRAPERQNMFPILQGHLDISKGGLRELCLAGFKYRDLAGNTVDEKDRKGRIPGFAIGGLVGGESKEDFWKVVNHACKNLPDDRPRYLMGVGYPLDLVVCTALGVDMYDCVYPTRTARFGVALVDDGQMKLKRHEFAPGKCYSTENCEIPIDSNCPCEACSRGVTRGRFHALLKADNTLAVQLLTQHNVTYMMGLVNRMRKSILEKEFSKFVKEFINKHFSSQNENGDTPQWVKEALKEAGIILL